MKQLTYISILLSFCGVLLAGCDRYLDITPKGKTLLTTVAHYDQWLNAEELMLGHGGTFAITSYMTDLVDVPNITNPPVQMAELMYVWAPQFSTDLNTPPALWGEQYAKINLFNTVILGVDDAVAGTNAEKRSLKAEALLGRALEYFYLLNEYGKPYDAATAENDLAVPFVTSNDVTQVVPGRSTVAQIYQRIIADITMAIPDLPLDNSTNRFRGSTAAAYSLLARVYFYARNYDEARKYAELALENTRATMIDFNGELPTSNLLTTHPDVIFGRMVIGQNIASLDFMRSFASNDLRVRRFYTSTDGYSFTVRGATTFFPAALTPAFTYVNTGTSVQEMKLVVAECAARAGDLPAALQALDDVRKNRFAAASYVKYESGNPAEVLEEVLLERRHELPFNGLRWFDMRRLGKENRMGTVTRYNAQGEVITTLEPNSTRYTLQVPMQVTAYHPEMPQNP